MHRLLAPLLQQETHKKSPSRYQVRIPSSAKAASDGTAQVDGGKTLHMCPYSCFQSQEKSQQSPGSSYIYLKCEGEGKNPPSSQIRSSLLLCHERCACFTKHFTSTHQRYISWGNMLYPLCGAKVQRLPARSTGAASQIQRRVLQMSPSDRANITVNDCLRCRDSCSSQFIYWR